MESGMKTQRRKCWGGSSSNAALFFTAQINDLFVNSETSVSVFNSLKPYTISINSAIKGKMKLRPSTRDPTCSQDPRAANVGVWWTHIRTHRQRN